MGPCPISGAQPGTPSCRATYKLLKGLARRTGRFPQLVDPRSRINGLLSDSSPRFRRVSLEKPPPLPAQAVVAADAQPLPSSTLGRSFRRATRRLISAFHGHVLA
jgi:hypothetical protein